jgi:alpha-glutamyl/putrescinyl thymine pyrophosphorylase clade 1
VTTPPELRLQSYRNKPVPRDMLYRAFWTFAAERQLIFHRRVGGEAGPWTRDPILMKFKFCNVFRASDRVSQFLIHEVIYRSDLPPLEPEDVFMRVLLFRLFSRPPTWRYLEDKARVVRRTTLQPSVLGDALDELRQQGPIYTSAFILCAHDAYGYKTKHRNHLELVREMFKPGRLGRSLALARSLEDVYLAILKWPMMGPFMSYQLAIDLNYTEHFDFSEDDFTVAGPGAVRGLKKVFASWGDFKPAEIIRAMVDAQDDEFARFNLSWHDLFGRRLHAIDVQGLFCEVDKYARVAFPELTSNRTRIKQVFKPSTEPLEMYFPPKWGINSHLAASAWRA